MNKISLDQIKNLIDISLDEDSYLDDITSKNLIDKDHISNAYIISKSEGILCGVDVLELVFKTVDVSALAAKTSDAKSIPLIAFNFKNLPRLNPVILPICTYQSFELLRLLTIS